MANKLLARVKAGAAFLDVMKPGWLKKIDTEKLDLSEPNVCMLGEIYGDYSEGKDELGISESQAVALGFQVEDEINDDGFEVAGEETDYSLLTRTWKRLVATLRKSNAKRP